ncbi:Uncharacterised protein [Vibrio cholerae]|nr:Uncharacterised protein [Vibrio cholerae]
MRLKPQRSQNRPRIRKMNRQEEPSGSSFFTLNPVN